MLPRSVGSLSSARQLARKLFANLEKERTGDVDGERVLIVEDFLPVRLVPFFLPSFLSFPSTSTDSTSFSLALTVLPKHGGRQIRLPSLRFGRQRRRFQAGDEGCCSEDLPREEIPHGFACRHVFSNLEARRCSAWSRGHHLHLRCDVDLQ